MLPIAKILKSNGTDGGILVSLRGVDVEEIDSGNPVFIVFDELPVPFFIVSVQRKGASRAVLHLADVENLRDAEELVGRDILVEGEDESWAWNPYRATSVSMSAISSCPCTRIS